MTLLLASSCRTKVAAAAANAASKLALSSTCTSMPVLICRTNYRCVSSKHPPRKTSNEEKKSSNERETTSTKLRIQSSNYKQIPRFKNVREKERNRVQSPQTGNSSPPVIQPSSYYYNSRTYRLGYNDSSTTSPRLNLPSMNASALLDPLNYCKGSSKGSHSHGVSRGISGTDAARRLLRGKKYFLTAARGLQTPALLKGHGVPPQIWQHCIDMADALLLQHGEDVVECTFHNYHPGNVLPQVLRIRRSDAANSCSPWPPSATQIKDWDYHLTLYLTVMERLACNLGMVLKPRHATLTSEDSDDDDVTSSPLLFPGASKPHWNVDVLRGAYFDLHHADGPSSIYPCPIVEFTHDSETTAHVLIRIQGPALPNAEFGKARSQQPVTLVFDACFRNETL